MKKGNIVKRAYSISNMKKYSDPVFLKELDIVSSKEGSTILNRAFNYDNSSVEITARFDSDNWDVCKSLELLTSHGISVEPISNYIMILEKKKQEFVESYKEAIKHINALKESIKRVV